MPEILNILGGLSLKRNGTGTDASSSGFRFGNAWKKPKAKITKNDTQSACDLKENIDFVPKNRFTCFQCLSGFKKTIGNLGSVQLHHTSITKVLKEN